MTLETFEREEKTFVKLVDSESKCDLHKWTALKEEISSTQILQH